MASTGAVPVLETPRLTLRWLEPADAGFLFELMNDPDWLRHIGDRGIREPADARRYLVEVLLAQCERLGFGLYRVGLRDGDSPIGLCGLVKRDWLDDVDIGFAFLPMARGQGYAREAAAATLDLARARFGFTRVAAIVAPGNAASVRLLERLGLHFERMVTPPGEATAICLYATTLGIER